MRYSTIVCLVSFLLVISAPVIHAESAVTAMTNDEVPVYGIDSRDQGSEATSDSRCCLGIRGNVDGDSGDLVNISDMTYLVAYLFSGGAVPPCFEEGDVNADEVINISDMTYLVAYLFSGGPAPEDCPSICPPTVTDYDGNVYQTVLIGDQCWMMENLKVTHYRNGDPIPHVTDGSIWRGLSTGAYCEYANNPAHVATYGRLYNWYAVDDSRNIAPEGWRVPTDEDWKQLEMHLGMSQAEADGTGDRGTDEGGKLKDTTVHWASPNTGATNESGFTALPGGFRTSSGNFYNMGSFASFWSSSDIDSNSAWYRYLSNNHSQVSRLSGYMEGGFSVRCIRD